MKRRRLIGLVPASAIAFAARPRPAAATTPESVAAAPAVPAKALSPAERFGEPLPIQIPAADAERAAEFLTALQAATVDPAQLDPDFRAFLPADTFTGGAEYIRPFGPAQALVPFETRTTADGHATYFRAKFASETLTYIIKVSPAGLVNGFSVRRSPGYRFFDCWLRDISY